MSDPDWQEAMLESELIAESDPLRLFQEWYLIARQSEPNDANAMALATATRDGRPSIRMVLLKGFDAGGFIFYTNRESRKGGELDANPAVALLFHWKSVRRQIRIEGPVTAVESEIADAYFASRARDSRLGAVASDQSRPLASRSLLIDRLQAARERFGEGAVERPEHWIGYRVVPAAIEFWIDRPHRLHERRRYARQNNDRWTSVALYP